MLKRISLNSELLWYVFFNNTDPLRPCKLQFPAEVGLRCVSVPPQLSNTFFFSLFSIKKIFIDITFKQQKWRLVISVSSRFSCPRSDIPCCIHTHRNNDIGGYYCQMVNTWQPLVNKQKWKHIVGLKWFSWNCWSDFQCRIRAQWMCTVSNNSLEEAWKWTLLRPLGNAWLTMLQNCPWRLWVRSLIMSLYSCVHPCAFRLAKHHGGWTH